MKNNYLLKTGLGFILACLISTGVFAQVVVVGSLSKDKPTVTNLADATRVLKSGLSTSATVSDVYIDLEPATGKYFLIGRIGNDPVSGKAVELQVEGSSLKAVGGPGIEVICNGINCSACIPVVTKWKVKCVCEDNPKKPNYQCDMTSKIVVTIW
jgi:hypothetical protein